MSNGKKYKYPSLNELNEGSIESIRNRYGLSMNIIMDRHCLKCEREFTSTHSGNRLCTNCHSINNNYGSCVIEDYNKLNKAS